MALIKRRGSVEDVQSSINDPDDNETKIPLNLTKLVSTGSTLLDLAISGGVTERGGIPGGMFVEIFGPSGAGKTALLSEIAASTQLRGGTVKFLDPEARLDKEYSKIYGVSITDDKFSYARPDTVSELFTDEIWGWNPPKDGMIHTICADSLAALSTNLEMDKDEGDKMGMRRAKEFSEGMRKTCRLIAHNNWLIAMSNQIRMGEGGKVSTPGGQAVPFYSSLRLQVKKGYPSWQIKREKKMGRVEIEKVIGIISEVEVIKSSVDEPYRSAPLSVVFGYGIDTIRDELQYYKKMAGETTYNCFDKNFQAVGDACEYIEANKMKTRLQDRTIGMWREVQAKFKTNRGAKDRS